MQRITLVDLHAQPVDGLRSILPEARVERFRQLMTETAERLSGRTVWNINSTAEGGGVAEMLGTLLPYAIDTGWDVKWAVMFGDDDFFDVTKGIHNALHGMPTPEDDFWTRAPNSYGRITDANAEQLTAMIRPGDLVLIHDPQAAGLIVPLIEAGAAVAWQSHIGTDDPTVHTLRAWDFLRPFVERADRYVFTRKAYLWDGLDPDRMRIIPPSIDALSTKNRPMDEKEVASILRDAGILEAQVSADARIVLEVSRWDRLKDPTGFVRMYAEHLSDRHDVHLVYAGPETDGVDDDPEAREVLEETTELWRSLSPDLQRRIHLLEISMDDIDRNAAIINALQCHADVIVQKSIQEGFGLTVSEAMWKSRPVVASRVGGIQDQIEHDVSGLLVDDPHDVAAFAGAVGSLLDDRDRAQRLGKAAHERVCDHFLAPRQLEQYAHLMTELAELRSLTP